MCLCVDWVLVHYSGLLDNPHQSADQDVQETHCVGLDLVQYLLLGSGIGSQVENRVFECVVGQCDGQRLGDDHLELRAEQQLVGLDVDEQESLQVDLQQIQVLPGQE